MGFVTRILVPVPVLVLIISCAFYYYYQIPSHDVEEIIVETPYGKIRGITDLSREGKIYYKFTSVPYAKPPLGDLRFEPPQAIKMWDGVWNADKSPPDCIQLDYGFRTVVGYEDCLYLNIYVPKNFNTKTDLNTMVYIHGGHFLYGTSNLYSPEYFMDLPDTIIILMHYRLGALGFLNTGDGIVGGNMGLKDQNLALRWIKNSIKSFGGNPEKITIFGESAGGTSVSLHMISPMSKGLFSNAISLSGSALCPWAFTQYPKKQAKRFGEKVNCLNKTESENFDSTHLLKCLKSKPAEEIVAIHHEAFDIFNEPEAFFGPSIESFRKDSKNSEIFLPESPEKLLKDGKSHKVPWISGINSEEGGFRSAMIITDEGKLQLLSKNWTDIAKNLLFLYNDDSHIVAKKIREYYFGKSVQFTIDDYQKMTDLIGDRYFVSCVKDAAVYHSKHSPTYLYYFTYKPNLSAGHIMSVFKDQYHPILEMLYGIGQTLLYKYVLGWEIMDFGVSHGDEIGFFWKMPSFFPWHNPMGSKHFNFSKSVVQLWGSFAKNGYPGKFNGVEWTPIDSTKKLKYLRIGKSPALIDEPFTSRLDFLKSLNFLAN